jgi:hypothetical protein
MAASRLAARRNPDGRDLQERQTPTSPPKEHDVGLHFKYPENEADQVEIMEKDLDYLKPGEFLWRRT